MTGTAKMKLSNGFFYTLVGAMTVALVGMAPANAEAKDKLIMSMTQDGSGSDLFVGCQSSGLVKMMGPKIQVQLKKLAGKPSGDGILCTDDDIICIIESERSYVRCSGCFCFAHRGSRRSQKRKPEDQARYLRR